MCKWHHVSPFKEFQRGQVLPLTAIYNVLRTGWSGEHGASLQRTGRALLDRLGFNSRPYGKENILGAAVSGVPAGVGYVEGQHFPSEPRVERATGKKVVVEEAVAEG